MSGIANGWRSGESHFTMRAKGAKAMLAALRAQATGQNGNSGPIERRIAVVMSRFLHADSYFFAFFLAVCGIKEKRSLKRWMQSLLLSLVH